MSTASPNANNFCYRHPNRQSFILCQRCGRTICPECQTQAAVGVQCPDCVREGRASIPRTKPRLVTAFSRTSRVPVVTYSIIAITVVMFGVQFITGGTQGSVTRALMYWGPLTVAEPWRMLTALVLHSGVVHILVNMYSLFIFGPILERMLGRVRFIALYLISGLGGSVAVLLLNPMTPVIGASGAIFGLLGAFFIITRRLGGNSVQLLIVIGINLAIGFVPGFNISWQAHLGGVVVGAAVATVYFLTRRPQQKNVQIAGVVGITAALIAITAVRFFTLFA